MTVNRWTLLAPDAETVAALCKAINVSEPIARCLVNRGITSFEAAKEFFRPSMARCHSPFLMKDMDKAARRVSQAIDAGERLMIYGDYDVDGTSATSMLYLYLRRIGAQVSYYVNDRFTEGYGVSISGLEYAVQNGVRVVVSVDCGITAIEPALYCKEHGIDFIVCDHHETKHDTGEAELPDAFAVLDAKQPGCEYPFKELSGCGVAFKLMQAVSELRGTPPDVANRYLDLVALAAAADIVDLNGENRILAAEGMKQIATAPSAALKAMATIAKLDLTKTTTSNIVFTIAPRVNAAGRMGNARRAIAWLIAETDAEALVAAETLEAENTERRDIDREITAEALRHAEAMMQTRARSSLVLYNPDWHQGVIGIVASRVAERFYLPTVIFTDNGDDLKGSVRQGVAGFNVYDALAACTAHIKQFGGHAAAAGLSLNPRRLDDFRDAFDRACEERLPLEMRTPELFIDAELDLNVLTSNFLATLEQFAPHGPKSRQPLFITRGVLPAFKPQLLKEKHLKFAVKSKDGKLFDVIGFNMLHFYKLLESEKRPVSLVYSVEPNEWNGRVSIQLRLRDMKVE